MREFKDTKTFVHGLYGDRKKGIYLKLPLEGFVAYALKENIRRGNEVYHGAIGRMVRSTWVERFDVARAIKDVEEIERDHRNRSRLDTTVFTSADILGVEKIEADSLMRSLRWKAHQETKEVLSENYKEETIQNILFGFIITAATIALITLVFLNL